MIEVTLIKVLAAGFSSVVLGFIWYHPRVFGAAWMRLVNMTPEMAARGKRRMPLNTVFAMLSGMLVAYVMGYVGIAWGFYDWIGAIVLGLWSWIGFVAPTMFSLVLWEQRSFKLYLIDALYWLAAFLVIAIILVS